MGRYEWMCLALFAGLLAVITWRHEMWRDELQAWLIVRDSHSARGLLHALHYEGHPLLWYLLLLIPAHISWNPAWMQVINGLLAVGVAWILLSARELPRTMRTLLLFSFFFFYQYGVIARSYALTTFLLLAAARCVLGKKQHRRLAVLLLVLAINAHVFAIPIAAAIFLWMFRSGEGNRGQGMRETLRDGEFWLSALVLAIGVGVSYLVAKPASDVTGLQGTNLSLGMRLLTAESMCWQMFVPYVPGRWMPYLNMWFLPTFASCSLSCVLLATALLLLRTIEARLVFLGCTVLEIVEMAVTVRVPSIYHFGFIFAAFVIALQIDAAAPGEPQTRVGFPRGVATVLLYAFLGMQTMAMLCMSTLDLVRPYSGAKDVAEWLRKNQLDGNPMVLQSSYFTTAIVGYLERPSAYYPSCRCFGSYELRNRQRDPLRMATVDDLKAARGNSPLPVLLIASESMQPADPQSLGLVEIHATPPKELMWDEQFVIYEEKQP